MCAASATRPRRRQDIVRLETGSSRNLKRAGHYRTVFAVMSFVLLFASAALAACLALTARTENIARAIGAWMLG